jgi:hypothetical protein
LENIAGAMMRAWEEKFLTGSAAVVVVFVFMFDLN